MATDEPRRFLVAVGVESYKKASWDRLEHVPRELDLIVSLLTAERLGTQRILQTECTLPRKVQLLAALRDWIRATLVLSNEGKFELQYDYTAADAAKEIKPTVAPAAKKDGKKDARKSTTKN